jgi:very-short-patch-repair endonuclease
VESDGQRPLKHMEARLPHGIVVTDGWPDAAIAWIAAGQETLITHAQLIALGLHPRAISRGVARGRIHRVHRGVYSLVPLRVRPRRAPEWAAILVHGASALLSHGTAAQLHGLPWREDGVVHVTLVGRPRRAAHAGIALHRTATLHRDERRRVDRLPVTSVARTVIDLSPRLEPRRRELLVDRALKKTSLTKLIEALDRHPRRPGTPALRALLDPTRPSTDTWSRQEEHLRELIRRAGLPQPESNVELYNGYFPDLLWRDQRVIVEYDSEEFHLGRVAFHDDRTRHNRLEADGYRVLHVTRRHLAERPEEVLVWIARALVR